MGEAENADRLSDGRQRMIWIIVVGGTIAGVMLANFFTSCMDVAQKDERCGWK